MQHYWKSVGSYGTVGLELALSILVGLLGGQWLDKKFGTGSWLTLIGLGFGIAAGARSVWRALGQANREAERLELEAETSRKEFNDHLDPKP